MSAAGGTFRQPEGQHPLPLHGPRFDADPQATYEKLRATGPIAPVELAPGVYAQLTTTYEAAQHLLTNTPRLFVRDPKRWDALREGSIPPDSPVLMMIQDRPNALWTDGAVHERYRSAIADSLQKVDTLALTRTVTQIADGLIDAFADRGTCDLVADFTALLPMQTMFGLCGCPADIGGRIVGALIKLFDTAQDAYAANAELERACLELVLRKRADPGTTSSPG